jgi:hypothetical protein
MLRKTSAAAAVIGFAIAGSALFGGAALADDGKKDDKRQDPSVSFTGGAGGAGGDVAQECKQDATAFNIFEASHFKAGDVSQTATATNNCTATGGAGGAGGAGATY